MKQIAEIIEGRPLFHITSSDSVREAARMMSRQNVGAIAVLDEGRLVGVFSERDVLTRVVAEGRNPENTTVANVMSKEIVYAEPTDHIDDALQKMYSRGCRHLPVIDDNRLLGMISIRDLLQIDDEANKAKATFLNELVTYSPDYET
jgi:CBS domain-containing protein